MNARLLPCPACARHVRVSEEACPFCAAALPATMASRPLPRSPTTRLSRAALFALGTSAAAIAACGGSTEGDSSTFGDGGAAEHEGGREMPLYGGPPPHDGGGDAPFLVDAAYGGPPQDAASDADDGGSDAEGGAVPAYGAPPP